MRNFCKGFEIEVVKEKNEKMGGGENVVLCTLEGSEQGHSPSIAL